MVITRCQRINDIRLLWEKLYSQNRTATFFQSFSWNLCLEQRFRSLHFMKYRNCVLEYLIVDEEVIAPLVINKSEKCITILGNEESSDYLSYIHGNITVDYLAEAISRIMVQYANYSFRLCKINESSLMYKAIEKLDEKVKFREAYTTSCVMVLTDYEKSFYDSLSKSKRQNFRTSLNRIEKDGHSYQIETHYGKIDNKKSVELYRVYFQRRTDCDEQPKGEFKKLYSTLRYILGVSRLGDCKDVLSNYAKNSEVFLATIKIDGILAAYCEGGYSNDGKRLCIARVATNSDYYKYSPGMLMFVNIIESLKNQIDCFDLTRGTEQYKFDLNGVLHLNHSYLLTL